MPLLGVQSLKCKCLTRHRLPRTDPAGVDEAASQLAAALRQAMSAQFRARAAECSRQLQQEVRL